MNKEDEFGSITKVVCFAATKKAITNPTKVLLELGLLPSHFMMSIAKKFFYARMYLSTHNPTLGSRRKSPYPFWGIGRCVRYVYKSVNDVDVFGVGVREHSDMMSASEKGGGVEKI